jgi:hypothetical protein
MTSLKLALHKRFGEECVTGIPVHEGEIPLLHIELHSKSNVSILMTDGLSEYCMPVPEKQQGHEFNELYFCLPSYWLFNDASNPQMNWVFPWIQRLANYVMKQKTWFGHGHTMPCGKEMLQLSATMKQNHFFISSPILLEEELAPIQLANKTIHFLAIIPIFPDEMDYKQGKGTFKFVQKLRNHGITEKLDDYRGTILRSKWRFF